MKLCPDFGHATSEKKNVDVPISKGHISVQCSQGSRLQDFSGPAFRMHDKSSGAELVEIQAKSVHEIRAKHGDS